MQKQFESGLVWFRRDLRLHDNRALLTALQQCRRVYGCFVFDSDILHSLPRTDRRVAFIRESLLELDAALQALSGRAHAGLIVLQGRAQTAVPELALSLGVQVVFAATDYEPQALARDAGVGQLLAAQGMDLQTVKDQVIFEKREVLTQMGTHYGVFTPYKKAWLGKVSPTDVTHGAPALEGAILCERPAAWQTTVPTLTEIGFSEASRVPAGLPCGERGAQQLLNDFLARMDDYHATRDYPAVKGPSYLGMHLRFGTVSIRQLVSLALEKTAQGSTGASVWLSELIWRDFYFQILANFPHVAQGPFRPAYAAIVWEQGAQAEQHFAAWCAGQTGYPIVDAAMAQLNTTGYMHNRLRMISGSFLVKDLGIDWRRGEAYFAEKLNDFDLSANNGGWQWVSSSGCDAQPYFRIFNPVTQSQRFDPQGQFIRRYLPALAKLSGKQIHAPWLVDTPTLATAGIELGVNYCLPLVDHATARAKTLQRYAVVKG
jgi:deoxyribodipyrimidine photo-lyase